MSQTPAGPKGPLQGTTWIVGAAVIKNRFVKRGADLTKVILSTAAFAKTLGIATDNQDNVGRSVPVAERPGEEVNIEAGAAFALDAYLTSDSVGRAVTATSGQPANAIARQAAGAVGDYVPVMLLAPGTLAP